MIGEKLKRLIELAFGTAQNPRTSSIKALERNHKRKREERMQRINEEVAARIENERIQFEKEFEEREQDIMAEDLKITSLTDQLKVGAMSTKLKRNMTIANEAAIEKVTSHDQEVLSLTEKLANLVAKNDLFEFKELTSKLDGAPSEKHLIMELIKVKTEHL